MSYAAPHAALVTPPVLANFCPWAGYSGYMLGSSQAPGVTLTGPAANQAIYVPFVVTTPATFTRGWWYNGTTPDATNNVSVGIYTPDGVRQATTGNVAIGAASVIVGAAFSANYAALPGLYYMGIMYTVGADANGIFGIAASVQHGRWAGLYTQAVGSNPLPANATFATWSSMAVPFFGIATTSFAI